MTATAARKQRGPGRPWRKGQSGNPAGRKPGSLNKHSVERIVEQSGESPLAFLLRQMRNPKNALALRLEAAGRAAPFCHARLALSQHFIGDHRQPVEVMLIADGEVRRIRDGQLLETLPHKDGQALPWS